MAVRVLAAILSYAIALCGIVPLIPWLPMAPRLLLAAGMLAGLWQSWRGAWRIKPWLLNTIAVMGVLFYAVQVNRTNPVTPLASMLSIMLAVRLLGEKTSRYCLQIYVLSLFCLAASTLFDLSLLFLVYLAAMLFMVAVALVLLTFHDHDQRLVLSGPDLRRVLTAGLLMPLASIPLLAIFFPLLPRTQVPLWNFQAASASRITGLADQVAPGRTSAIEESQQLVFRAEMPRQSDQQPYWRAVVFNRLTGARWQRDPAIPPEEIRYGTARVRQEIYPEPGPTKFLPALDAPARIAGLRSRRSPDGIFAVPAATHSHRQHYSADSAIDGSLPVRGTIDREYYRQLPAGLSPRIEALADEIGQPPDDTGRLALLERHFRTGNYRYAMNGLPTGSQALEQFLFDSRQGNCEFFAAAFALVARAAGLPARLVGGYLGGEYNDLGGYYLVREQMAHVWVEVFLEGQGWVRSDPSRFAVNAGELWRDTQGRSLATRLRLILDSLDHAWNRSVITYDLERQLEIAVSLGKRFHTFPVKKNLVTLAASILALLAITMVFVILHKRGWRLFSAEERLLRDFYRRLERDCGVTTKPGTQGLFELAEATGNAKVREFVAIYAAAVYRDRRLPKEERDRLRNILAGGFAEPNPPASNST